MSRRLCMLALLLVACGGTAPNGCNVMPDMPPGLITPVGLNSGGLNLDFSTQAVADANLIYSRTGSTLYLQNSASTVTSLAAGSGSLWEDRGDGRAGGVWSFPLYTNSVNGPFDHSAGAGWSHFNDVYTADTGTAPDGTVTADRTADHTAVNRTQLTEALGALDGSYRSNSTWIRAVGGDLPTAAGYIQGDATSRVDGDLTFGISTTWARFATANLNTTVNHVLTGPGSSPGSVFVNSATGAYEVWGDQQVKGIGVADLPLVDGSTGAGVVQLASKHLGSIVYGGDLEISGGIIAENLYSQVLDTGYVHSMSDSAGLFALRNAASVFTVTARGSDVTFTGADYAGHSTKAYSQLPDRAFIAWRYWYRPSSGTSGMRFQVNGASEGDITGTASGAAIPAPTDFYVGSNAGATSMPVRHAYVRTHRSHQAYLPAEFVVLGDSIAAFAAGTQMMVAAFVYTAAEARTRPGIISFAFPGDKIGTQKTKFMASPYYGDPKVKAVIIESIINNIYDGVTCFTEASAIAALQDLVNTIAASNPSAKIIISQATPELAYLTAQGQAACNAVQTAVNNDIAGTGGITITGVDARITSVNPQLDDGSGNLISTCDSSDHRHPLTFKSSTHDGCRMAIGAAWRSALQGLGLL